MTRYFSNYEEVEYVFDLTFTPEQRELVQIYVQLGIRPDPKGCWTCTPAYIRKITSDIDIYEYAVDQGEEEWPWPLNKTETVWELNGM